MTSIIQLGSNGLAEFFRNFSLNQSLFLHKDVDVPFEESTCDITDLLQVDRFRSSIIPAQVVNGMCASASTRIDSKRLLEFLHFSGCDAGHEESQASPGLPPLPTSVHQDGSRRTLLAHMQSTVWTNPGRGRPA
jgi:hypothetical protein